jgi:periplasmic copper chaperone A
VICAVFLSVRFFYARLFSASLSDVWDNCVMHILQITIKFIAVRALFAFAAALFSLQTHAQTVPDVKVEAAWVRGTAEGQSGTGGFMTLTSKESLRLVGLASPVAGIVEIHEMKMENDVMKMRALPGLDLPAGKAVEFKSGGNHMMLMDLKQALKHGSTVPVTLTFADAQGKQSTMTVQMPVAFRAPKP